MKHKFDVVIETPAHIGIKGNLHYELEMSFEEFVQALHTNSENLMTVLQFVRETIPMIRESLNDIINPEKAAKADTWTPSGEEDHEDPLDKLMGDKIFSRR